MAYSDLIEDSKSYKLFEAFLRYAAVSVSFLFLKRYFEAFLKWLRAAFYNSESKRFFKSLLNICTDNSKYFMIFSVISIFISHFLLSLLSRSKTNFLSVMIMPVIFYAVCMKKNGLTGFLATAYKNSLIYKILNKKA